MDGEYVALYMNAEGTVYKTFLVFGYPYPIEQILHVHRNESLQETDVRDQWNNKYVAVSDEGLLKFTWKGQPISLLTALAGGDRPTKSQVPSVVAPEDSKFQTPTLRHWEQVPSAHKKTRGRVEEEQIKSRKDTIPIRQAFSFFEDNERYPAREEPPKPLETFPFPRERGRGKRDDYTSRQIRPTTLQKFCGKFDGTGDPYEHVSQFHQLLFAEGVTDTHCKVQSFGLTLSGTARS